MAASTPMRMARPSPRCASRTPWTREWASSRDPRDGIRSHRQPVLRRLSLHLVDGEVQTAAGEFRYLMEICDPCESADCAYKIDDVVVSDFYRPIISISIPGQIEATASTGASRPAPGAEGRISVLVQSDNRQVPDARNLDRDPQPRIHTFDQGPQSGAHYESRRRQAEQPASSRVLVAASDVSRRPVRGRDCARPPITSYFTAEKAVGERMKFFTLATMAPFFSVSARALIHSG